ncbi:MAG: flagellar motor protein MotB [Immundisolibacteraceae bacterium]|nr:flagellar motor protein MotB [Immundisolibacteraceae bacterium]
MSEADCECEEVKCPAGIPAWVMTFADLMTLLMCFFVLLLSFSEMDQSKYKKIAGSMQFAFGVQREIKTKDPPKGTSIIAKEFSPGKPTQTLLKTVRQHTIDMSRNTLEFTDSDSRKSEKYDNIGSELVTSTDDETANDTKDPDSGADGEDSGQQDAAEGLESIVQELLEEVREGLIELDFNDGRVIIRIREQGSFVSGGAEVSPSFVPVLDRIGAILERLEGEITISGHTDSIPSQGGRFRSNWDLSALRSASVAHELLAASAITPQRLLVVGRADTVPLMSNDTIAGRSRNRRVEISIDLNADPMLGSY